MGGDDSSIYYDTYNEGSDPEEKQGLGKWISLFLKIVGAVIAIAVYLFLFYRIWSAQTPRKAKEYLWSEPALAAAGEKVTVYRQEMRNYEWKDEVTGEVTVVQRDEYYRFPDGRDIDGDYRFSDVSYTALSETAGQMQLTFRYNRAVLPYLQSDYGLTALPEGYPFVFVLQGADGSLYREYRYKAVTRSVYTYRRLVFDGLPASPAALYTLQVYYAGDLQGTPYLSMVVYDAHLPAEQDSVKTPSSADAFDGAYAPTNPLFDGGSGAAALPAGGTGVEALPVSSLRGAQKKRAAAVEWTKV